MPVLWGHPNENNKSGSDGPVGSIYQYAKWFRLQEHDFHIENNDGEWCCCAWPTSSDEHLYGYSSAYFPTYEEALQDCYEGLKRILQKDKSSLPIEVQLMDALDRTDTSQ